MYWTCANNVFLWEYKTGSEVEVSPLSLEFARNYADGYGTSYAICRFSTAIRPPLRSLYTPYVSIFLGISLLSFTSVHSRFVISHSSLCKICRSPVGKV